VQSTTEHASGILGTIGKTPVVQLTRVVPSGAADVFVKLEYFNPTGSYKDRMALAMIEGAEPRAIDEDEARKMVRRLAREEGVFAGTSSGVNVVAALKLAQELGPGHRVATVAVDSGLKYLAGDLFA
jgi:cysteine synthase